MAEGSNMTTPTKVLKPLKRWRLIHKKTGQIVCASPDQDVYAYTKGEARAMFKTHAYRRIPATQTIIEIKA